MIRIQRILALLLIVIMIGSMAGALAQESTWNADRLNAYLAALAEEAGEPWQKAIYQAGAENLSVKGDVLTFLLRGFTFDVKSLPKQKEDPDGWLTGFFSQIGEYSMEASLTLKDGEPTPKSVTKLKTTVKNAAAKAKEAFSQQTVKTALLDMVFPVPFNDATAYKKGSISPSFYKWMSRMGLQEDQMQAFSALLYAQNGRQVSFNKGPHSLEFSVKFTEPTELLTQSELAVMADLSKVAKANATDSERLKGLLGRGLLDAAAALSKKAKNKQVFSVDVDQLALGNTCEDYTNFLRAFTLDDTLKQLEAKVRDLPDYPALDYPANGRISGNTSGTKIIMKVPKDEYARYVQIRSANNDSLILDLFIRPGGSVTVRAPEGKCYLLIALGTTWYGDEALFGKDGILTKTDDIDIKSSRYYHTLTLGGVKDGNISSWSANEDMFKK